MPPLRDDPVWLLGGLAMVIVTFVAALRWRSWPLWLAGYALSLLFLWMWWHGR